MPGLPWQGQVVAGYAAVCTEIVERLEVPRVRRGRFQRSRIIDRSAGSADQACRFIDPSHLNRKLYIYNDNIGSCRKIRL
jgi:hypothetical protein